ncbi:MAG TPA: anthranilate phosphoribosyltransferase [Gammaproteobacteria bacterium]|nr:anthranilate phosphoribosyltransferase [Gammaproteobacteria bacterium]
MLEVAKQDAGLMRSILSRIATGPELSKDISRAEACAGLRLVLDGLVDPVEAGVFLIALRMKRESDDEMCGLLDAIRDATQTVVAPVDELIDLGDPYDGYARSLPIAPFLPAVLAACGVPSITHGVESMGPKYGVTHRQVLRAAGLPVDLTVKQASAAIADPTIGWAYLDQSTFCPKLYALARLRSLIVKRPALTTLEVLAGPVRARRHTHLVTGYVHKAYPRVYALLARAAGYDTALLVRGVEGGVVPSVREEGKYFSYKGKEGEVAREITAGEFGLAQSLRPPPIPGELLGDDDHAKRLDANAIARAAADGGQRALAGEPGPIRDHLIAAAALCLLHLDRYLTPLSAAVAVRGALDDGSAARRLRKLK